jgi:hypothetical protein
MKALTILTLLTLSLIGCKNESVSNSSTSNTNIKVELLFEHDGVKVYRFRDGRTVYYTDARGKTKWTVSNGKTTSDVSVETVE